MNRSITILFLLFMLLVTGAFASMAQNNYGFTLMGTVALCFGLFFLFQLIRKFRASKRPSNHSIMELAALTVLGLATGLNIFHMRIPMLNYVSMAAAALLFWVYLDSMRRHLAADKNNLWILLYYAGILIFLASFILGQFYPRFSVYADLVAFLCLLAFVFKAILLPLIRKGLSQERMLDVIGGFRNRSFLVASIFFVMALYGFAVRAGALPPLYADTYPKVFFDMTSGGELSKAAGRQASSPTVFKDAYERFVSRNLAGKR